MSDDLSGWDRVKGVVGAIAPTLGTMIAGPGGGAIGTMISRTLGVADHPSAVEKALKEDPQAAVRLAELETNLEVVRIEAKRDERLAVEATHQAALNQSDLVTKRTRPRIARQSWGAALTYAIITIFGQMAGAFYNANLEEGGKAIELAMISFDPLIFGTLAGPAVWYMGMRGAEKWKHGKDL